MQFLINIIFHKNWENYMLQITFVNDGTGTEGFGNYNYTVNVNKEQIVHSYNV